MEKAKNIELILINISGQDRPGVTSALTEILAKYEADILDIGQADIHHTLSLGILFKTDSSRSGEILKELLFKASELGVNIRFSPVAIDDYTTWVGLQGKNRYVITILARHISARQIAAVARVILKQGLNIDAIQRLTGRMSLSDAGRDRTKSKGCVEFSVRGTPNDYAGMQSEFMVLASELEFDISLQQDTMFRRCRRFARLSSLCPMSCL